MSIKEIKEAIESGDVLFGTRQALKVAKSKKSKKFRVFVSKDVRDFTVKKLEGAGIEFEVLKPKSDIAKELGLNFESEVFVIN